MRIRISWLDVKLGVRMLARYPGLTFASTFAIAVVVAVGVAAATGDAVVNGSLPFEDGDRIVAIENFDTAANQAHSRALHDFDGWKRDLKTVEEVGAYRLLPRNVAFDNRPAEPLRIAEISASAFRIARVPPLMGRWLLPADELVSAPPVVVLGHDEWRRRFGGDPGIVGKEIVIAEATHTVVGLMPDGFGFPENENYWVPLRLSATGISRGGGPQIYVFGRLAPGIDLDAAQAELTVAGQRAAADYPDTHKTLRPRVLPYARWFFGDMEVTYIVQFAVVLLLGIVGANVAVLVYARTATRRNEIAVRTALGADRRRIVTQLFAEGLVLSTIASGVGLAIAALVRRQLDIPLANAPFWVDTTLTSWPVIRNVLALTVLGAVIVGVIPALQATGRRRGLQHTAASAAQWTVGHTYGALIVVQVALAVAILPVAMATVWQTVRAGSVDPGFPAGQFLAARVSLDREVVATTDDEGYAARFRDRQDALIQRLRADAAVADISSFMALPGDEPNTVIEIEGRVGVHQSGTGRLGADFDQVGVDVLRPFGIRLLAGRGFDSRDLDAKVKPVIVNRTFVQRLTDGNPLGTRVRPRGDEGTLGPWFEIVGVVSDFPVPSTPSAAEPRMYSPVGRGDVGPVFIAVQVRGGTPAGFGNRLRELAAGVDRNLQLSFILPMDDMLRRSQIETRLAATVSGLLTFSVLLLSATGLYALMAFTVAQRRREIGLRVALGATHARLLATIMSRSFWQLAGGIAIGSALAAVMFGEGELTGEGQMWMLIPLALGVLTVGLAAAAAPARRALRIQPAEALRAE